MGGKKKKPKQGLRRVRGKKKLQAEKKGKIVKIVNEKTVQSKKKIGRPYG